MNRKKNYIIEPHIHATTKRNIHKTFEVLFIRKGKVRRSKLYYLRDRVGKSAKIKEDRN